MFKPKKIFKVIENLVIVFIFVIFVIAMSPILPLKGVPRTYIVVSGSMEPLIKTGAVAFTVPLKPTDAKVSDIVVFASPTNSKDVILHRIIGIKSTTPLRFQTKGDHNDGPDNWDLMGVGILGKYVFSIPYIGNIAAFVKKPLGFVFVIVVPALIYIVMQILSIKDAINEEVEKRLKDKLKKVPDPINKIFTLFIFLSVALSFATMHTARALFTDSVKIKGLSFNAAVVTDDNDNSDCNDGSDHHNDNNHDNSHDNGHGENHDKDYRNDNGHAHEDDRGYNDSKDNKNKDNATFGSDEYNKKHDVRTNNDKNKNNDGAKDSSHHNKEKCPPKDREKNTNDTHENKNDDGRNKGPDNKGKDIEDNIHDRTDEDVKEKSRNEDYTSGDDSNSEVAPDVSNPDVNAAAGDTKPVENEITTPDTTNESSESVEN